MGFKWLFAFYAALEIRELENSFFDVTNTLLVQNDFGRSELLWSDPNRFCQVQNISVGSNHSNFGQVQIEFFLP
jgi:hypothetical protein